MTLHTYTPNQCPYQVSTSYTLRFLIYNPDKIFKLKVTTARSKVKSRSHHDIAHLHPLTNVPTKYSVTHLSRSRKYRLPVHLEVTPSVPTDLNYNIEENQRLFGFEMLVFAFILGLFPILPTMFCLYLARWRVFICTKNKCI